MSAKVLVFILLLLATDIVAAKVFKWTDQNGETHYSESVPAEQKGQEMPSPPAPPIGSEVNNNQPDTIMQELKSAEKEREANREAQKKVSEAAARKSRCAGARKQLNILTQQVRLYNVDPNGERIYLDDDTRAEAIRKLSEVAASNCDSQ